MSWFKDKVAKPLNKKLKRDFVAPFKKESLGGGLIHQLTGTKEEKKNISRRLGGALSGAAGGFVKGGPYGAIAGGVLGYQSNNPLTGKRSLTELGKGYLAGAGMKGGQNILSGKGLMGSGGGLLGMGSKTPIAGVGGLVTKPAAGGGISKLVGSLIPSLLQGGGGGGGDGYQPGGQTVDPYRQQMIQEALARSRQARERRYFK